MSSRPKKIGAAMAPLAVVSIGAVEVAMAIPAAATNTCLVQQQYHGGKRANIGNGTIPAGWHSQITLSARAWNNASSNWGVHDFYPNFSGPITNAVWTALGDFQTAGWPDDPGMTTPITPFSGQNAATWLNSRYSWNTTGTMDVKSRNADVRTITTHEYGHLAVIGHPDWCGQNLPTSVMQVDWTTKHTISTEDANAIRVYYGN